MFFVFASKVVFATFEAAAENCGWLSTREPSYFAALASAAAIFAAATSSFKPLSAEYTAFAGMGWASSTGRL